MDTVWILCFAVIAKVDIIVGYSTCISKTCDYYATCKVHYWTNQESCRCPTKCTTMVAPVCGDDGTTYSNQCWMRVESCKEQRWIKAVHNGRCVSTTTSSSTTTTSTTTMSPSPVTTTTSTTTTTTHKMTRTPDLDTTRSTTDQSTISTTKTTSTGSPSGGASSTVKMESEPSITTTTTMLLSTSDVSRDSTSPDVDPHAHLMHTVWIVLIVAVTCVVLTGLVFTCRLLMNRTSKAQVGCEVVQLQVREFDGAHAQLPPRRPEVPPYPEKPPPYSARDQRKMAMVTKHQ